MPNFKNTYNLYKFTQSNQYFIAHQSIPFQYLPENNFTLESQCESPTPNHAIQTFSSYKPQYYQYPYLHSIFN
jgi:hypothetical protein